jgi:hypothetical protein
VFNLEIRLNANEQDLRGSQRRNITMAGTVSDNLYVASWRGMPVRWLIRSIIELPDEAIGSMRPHSGIMDAIFVVQLTGVSRLLLEISSPVAKMLNSYVIKRSALTTSLI